MGILIQYILFYSTFTFNGIFGNFELIVGFSKIIFPAYYSFHTSKFNLPLHRYSESFILVQIIHEILKMGCLQELSSQKYLNLEFFF